MKKVLIVAAALVALRFAAAQEPQPFEIVPRDTTQVFQLPDSLVHLTPWHPDFRTMSPVRTQPAVTMTSVVLVPQEHLPKRIAVLDDNSLRLGHHVVISNGQAWTNGVFLDAFLDARTLSFPLPR